VTRAKWADTPLAAWIRERMGAQDIRTKRALAILIKKRLGIQLDSAERQVARWTTSEKPVSLDERSRSALRAVLGAEPPAQEMGELEPRVAALERAVALIERHIFGEGAVLG
jgi:hypothetical protein